jgi:hypothetical protein
MMGVIIITKMPAQQWNDGKGKGCTCKANAI